MLACIRPAGLTYDLGLGYPPVAWRNLYLDTGLYMGGTQILDSSRNLNNIASVTVSGAGSFTGGIGTGSSSSSTLYVGTSGNFYNRVYYGSPSCSGVTDGWMGVDMTGHYIHVCIGGTLYKAALTI